VPIPWRVGMIVNQEQGIIQRAVKRRYIGKLTARTARGEAMNCLPAGIPRDPEPYEVRVGKKGPKEEEAEEEISRRPGHETVNLWGPTSGVHRPWRRIQS
jgi:hypothetical protein